MQVTVLSKAEKATSIKLNVTSRICSDWITLYGQVHSGQVPIPLAKVRITVNGNPFPSSFYCWRMDYRYLLHAYLGPGLYLIQIESQGLRSSPTLVLGANRRLRPGAYHVLQFRRVELAEGLEVSKRIAQTISHIYPDVENIFLVGGLANRGYTRRDIDLLVCSKTLTQREGERALHLESLLEEYTGYPISIFCPPEGIESIQGRKTILL